MVLQTIDIMQMHADQTVVEAAQPLTLANHTQRFQVVSVASVVLKAEPGLITQLEEGFHLIRQRQVVIPVSVFETDKDTGTLGEVNHFLQAAEHLVEVRLFVLVSIGNVILLDLIYSGAVTYPGDTIPG